MQRAITEMAEQWPVVILGVPLDRNSSFLRGPALAPQAIRQALHSDSANLCAEDGTDLGMHDGWHDRGDIALAPDATARAHIVASVAEVVAAQERVVALGGDHSITYPIIEAYARFFPSLTILHLDAHPDLYDDFEGNPWSHASPFARIMEAGLATRLVQVGIRTRTTQQRQQATRFGVETIEMRDWQTGALPTITGPLYLSLDLDVLDPAFAPGVSHHEPGGMTTRDVLGIIQGITAPFVGADVVELNPIRDPSGVTAMVAAKCLKEIIARMLAAR